MTIKNELTKEKFDQLVQFCTLSGQIGLNLYTEYDVKRGLRDSNGNGVLTGLTEISDVTGYKKVKGRKMPADSKKFFLPTETFQTLLYAIQSCYSSGI